MTGVFTFCGTIKIKIQFANNKNTENLYRIEEESAATYDENGNSDEEYFEEFSDEKPDFLQDEDVVTID